MTTVTSNAFTVPSVAGYPSHIQNATAGQWTAIGTNTLESVAWDYVANPPTTGGALWPTNIESIMLPWCGGVYSVDTHDLYVTGGGHDDYDGNEWYAFSLANNVWRRMNAPTLLSRTTQVNGWYPDGAPKAQHTYDHLGYCPLNGNLYRLGRGGTPLTTYQGWNPATDTWTALNASAGDDHSGSAIWHPTDQVFYIAEGHGTVVPSLHSYDPITDTKTDYGSRGEKGYGSMLLDTLRNRMIWKGNGFEWNTHQGYTIGNWTTTLRLSTSGAPTSKSPGYDYDSVRDEYVAWEGGSTLYIYNPTTDSWSTRSPGGVTPTPGTPEGINGRFAYAAEYDVFIGVNAISESVYMYKPSDWSPP